MRLPRKRWALVGVAAAAAIVGAGTKMRRDHKITGELHDALMKYVDALRIALTRDEFVATTRDIASDSDRRARVTVVTKLATNGRRGVEVRITSRQPHLLSLLRRRLEAQGEAIEVGKAGLVWTVAPGLVPA